MKQLDPEAVVEDEQSAPAAWRIFLVAPRFPLEGSLKGDVGPHKGYIGLVFWALGFPMGP